jgi:hypothetical protein
LQAIRVVGIEDGRVPGDFNRDSLDFGQLLERVYAL